MTLQVGWYGDDFTGATDTLAVAAQAKLRSLLFLDVPTPAQLAQAGPLDALGIAGSARTMSPQRMAQELPRIGAFFRQMGVPVLHYKCCSTFDSSPQTGSLGAAISLLLSYVDTEVAYVIGGQPGIGRFCCFSNLFAAVGAGGEICRLDRHATMKSHPVTPMNEADLRLHLESQGIKTVLPVHYPSYALSEQQLDEQIDGLFLTLQAAGSGALPSRKTQTQANSHTVNLPVQGPDAVLFDVALASDLVAVGRQLARQFQRKSLLAVGPSSVMQALAAWRELDQHGDSDRRDAHGKINQDARGGQDDHSEAELDADSGTGAGVGAVFVFVGSMSPVTAAQVRHAHSYELVPLDSAELIANPSYARQHLDTIAGLLDQGRHVLAYVAATDSDAQCVAPGDLALATADFVRHVVERQAGHTPLRRLGVAGGDTSSLAAKALDIWALSYAGSLSPGVTLCRAHSDDPRLHGLDIMLKGGQMGPLNIFERLLIA